MLPRASKAVLPAAGRWHGAPALAAAVLASRPFATDREAAALKAANDVALAARDAVRSWGRAPRAASNR